MRAASTTRLTLLHPVAPTPFLQYDICQSRSVWVFATGRARLRPSTSVPGESPGAEARSHSLWLVGGVFRLTSTVFRLSYVFWSRSRSIDCELQLLFDGYFGSCDDAQAACGYAAHSRLHAQGLCGTQGLAGSVLPGIPREIWRFPWPSTALFGFVVHVHRDDMMLRRWFDRARSGKFFGRRRQRLAFLVYFWSRG